MLKRYVKKIVKDYLDSIPEKSEIKELVKCDKCKVVMFRDDAHEVESITFGIYGQKNSRSIHYCKTHKPKYDEVVNGTVFTGPKYYIKEHQVDAKGKSIK